MAGCYTVRYLEVLLFEVTSELHMMKPCQVLLLETAPPPEML